MKKTVTLFSWSTGMLRSTKGSIKVCLILLFVFSGIIFSPTTSVAQCNSFGIDFKQGANRDNFGNYTLGEIHWIGSILQSSNSRYVEGMSTLQRIVFNNLPACGTGANQGYHKLRMKLEASKSGNHAYDFITSWDNALKASAAVAPGFNLMPANRADLKLHECGPAIGGCAETACNLITGNGSSGGIHRDLPVIFAGTTAAGPGETNLAILGDQNTTRNIIQNYEDRYSDNIMANMESYGRSVRVYSGNAFGGSNGDANNRVVFVGYGDANPNDGGDTYIYYDISWVSTSTNVVIEFAAHIAVGVDGIDQANETPGSGFVGLGVGYFLGQGASDISGGPYHVIVEDFQNTLNNSPKCEGNLGNLDNQLQGSQVLLVPHCDLTGPLTTCEGQTGLQYAGGVTNASNATYLWSFTSNTSPTAAQITAGQGTAGPVTVTAGSPGTFTLKLTVTNGGTTNDPDDNIVSICTIPVTVNANPALTCPPNRTVDPCQTQEAINTAYQAWLVVTGATNNGGSIGPDKCGGTKVVVFTATTDCGTSTCSASFTVTADHTPPGFTGNYDDVNLTCNSEIAPGSLGSATATDGCGAVTITSTDGGVQSNDCLRSLTRTFTARDGCNNTATVSRTVRWKAVLSNINLTVGGQSASGTQEFDLGCNASDVQVEAQLGSANALNGCATPTLSVVTASPTSNNPCERVRIRTFSATDDCGHFVSAARLVRWIVNQRGPQITPFSAPADLGCNPSPADIDGALGTITATDACANVTITSIDGPIETVGCSRAKTRTFTATGGCGNTATASRSVTWKSDNSAPEFTGSYGDVTLGCNPENPNGSLGSASATDGCGPVTITQSDGGVQSSGCARSITRKFTATDGCLNTATTSRTVRWTSDILPPTFTGSYGDVTLGCNPENPSGSLGSASATDGCGPVTITQSDGDVQSNGCARSITRKFTATDGCLNTATTSRTVRWTSDILPPVFTGSYGDVTLGCNPENPSGSLGSASATDGCGPVTITQSDGGVQSNGCARSITRKFTATDGCLNTATTSRTVRWTSDILPPVFTGSYGDVTLGCNPENPSGSLGSASATDGCGPVTITQSDGDVQSNGCARSITRKFTATDGCLNTATTSRTVRWTSDVLPPVFTGSYGDVTLGCNPENPNGSLGSASATDGCGPVTITQSDGDVQSNGCARSITRKFTATDGCLNTATTSRTVRWTSDVLPPVFTGSYGDVTLGCNPENPNGSLGSASATDGCGPVTITQSDGDVQSNGCARSITRKFTATDGCLNTATTSRTVRWTSDILPPVFTGSYGDVTLGCNPENPSGSLGSASATDGCGPVTITQSDGGVQSNGCARSITRKFTATDGCLNTATTSRTVRWTSDVLPPVFTGSYGDVTLGCNPENPSGSLGSASATDGCGPVTITQSDGDVQSNGCARSITRKFTATDGCLNTATTSRTVRWTSDVLPPVFTGSYGDVTLGCNPENPNGSLGSASATDGCGPVTITQSDGGVQSNGCARSITRKFTATDGCLNTATTSRTVRWTSDVLPPVFTGSYGDVTLGCNPENPNGSLGSASATDGCGPVTITQSDGGVQSNGCARSITRKFTATDGCLNTATTSRTVRWTSDVLPPVFTGSYGDVTLGCNPENPSGSLGSASATDGCGPVTITQSDGGVQSNGCARSITRKFTATDGCLNTATTSRTVRWTSDVLPPVFTGSYGDVTLGCNPENPNGSLGSASATDGCGPVTITQSDGDVQSNGCARSITRKFTATDGCLNTATTSRTVRWTSDVLPPVFTGSYGDVTLGCNPENPSGSLGSASATDGCGPVTITQSDGDVQSNGCARSITRKFTATDGCLNTATTSRTVRWTSDVLPPVFTGSYGDVTLGCNPENPSGSLGSASATDGCGPVTITQSDGGVQSNGCARSITRKFTATDGCLNTATTSRTVRWTSDVLPPVFTGSYGDVTLGCNPENPSGSLGSASATDGCGPVTITQSDGDVQSNGCARSITRKFTATDGCLNTATTSRTVRWTSDVLPPVFTGSYGDVTLGCNPENPSGSLGSASATDGCGPVTITQSDGDVQSNGCARSRTRKFTATDGCLNTATTSRTVRWTSDVIPPVFTSTPASVDLNCADAIPGIVTPTASDACGMTTVTMTGTTDNPANCSTGFQRIITRTWKATDACLNTATYTQTIRVKCCIPVCTLTQGAYGNSGGNICLPNGTKINQSQIPIIALTNEPGNMKVFGRQDLNRYWVIKLSDVTPFDASHLLNMLPGGTGAKVFELDNVAGVPEYANAPSWFVAPLQPNGNNKGKINNQLFAQTLTMYFNTAIPGNGLGIIALNGDSLIIQGRECGNPNPVGTKDTVEAISPSIVSYMSSHGYSADIAGLMKLANDALGGVNISPLKLGDVAGAVDRLNNLFDNCAMVVGYVPVAGGTNKLIVSSSRASAESAPGLEVTTGLEVTAYPNPFSDKVRFVIQTKVSGQGSLEVYNMLGQKIQTVYKGTLVAGKSQIVDYNAPRSFNGGMIYIFRVGGKQVTGKLMNIE